MEHSKDTRSARLLKEFRGMSTTKKVLIGVGVVATVGVAIALTRGGAVSVPKTVEGLSNIDCLTPGSHVGNVATLSGEITETTYKNGTKVITTVIKELFKT